MNILSLYIGDNFIRLSSSAFKNGIIEVESLAMADELPMIYAMLNDKTINLVSEKIEECYNSMKAQSKNVNIILPDSFTFSQIQEMPRLKEKELLSAIKYQADQFIPLPLEEASLDIEILADDPSNNKLLVLIVAASEKMISLITQMVEQAGLVPISIENELSAIGRFVGNTLKPSSTGTIMLNTGYSTSSLYYYNPDKKLITDAYTVRIGVDLFVRELKANLNIDSKKALEILRTVGMSQNASVNVAEIVGPALNDYVREVEKFVIAMKEKYQKPVGELYFFSSSTSILNFEQKLSAGLGITAKPYDFSSIVTKTPVVTSLPPGILPTFVSTFGGSMR